MRRAIWDRFQTGANLPRGVSYNAAKMKHWPSQKVPENFAFTPEQRLKAKALPRDTGAIPKAFVLSVLYRHQPCEVGALWGHCVEDPQIVLDSKLHLREVLQQARSEGFISFEMDPITHHWLCHLTRERYEEVRSLVVTRNSGIEQGLKQRPAADETANLSRGFEAMDQETKKRHLERLTEQIAEVATHLRHFQRTEIDYLPYTDLNGKVNFMWWYETVDTKTALPPSNDAMDKHLEESYANPTTRYIQDKSNEGSQG
ncbi:unnamed protein product [Phytomonas sp. Hart1]|nr:unnamed protein product [Phytomonas sp. Hart1]|eukprot:CCW67924.1 unnamed protein product [Phytomonas sp. isolate Hart1]